MDKLRVILIIVNVLFLFAVTVWLIYDVTERVEEKKKAKGEHCPDRPGNDIQKSKKLRRKNKWHRTLN